MYLMLFKEFVFIPAGTYNSADVASPASTDA